MDFHGGVVRADAPRLPLGTGVALGVEAQAEKRQWPANSLPHFRGVLADAAGEREGVDAFQRGGVGSDVLARTVRENLSC